MSIRLILTQDFLGCTDLSMFPLDMLSKGLECIEYITTLGTQIVKISTHPAHHIVWKI